MGLLITDDSVNDQRPNFQLSMSWEINLKVGCIKTQYNIKLIDKTLIPSIRLFSDFRQTRHQCPKSRYP